MAAQHCPPATCFCSISSIGTCDCADAHIRQLQQRIADRVFKFDAFDGSLSKSQSQRCVQILPKYPIARPVYDNFGINQDTVVVSHHLLHEILIEALAYLQPDPLPNLARAAILDAIAADDLEHSFDGLPWDVVAEVDRDKLQACLASQSLIVLSPLPERRRVASGENATELT
jgi:hypothetical protein